MSLCDNHTRHVGSLPSVFTTNHARTALIDPIPTCIMDVDHFGKGRMNYVSFMITAISTVLNKDVTGSVA